MPAVLTVFLLYSLVVLPTLADDRVWVAGWQETAALGTARAGAAVVRAGDHLYVIGGVDGRRFLKSVEYTRIGQDGALEPWQPTAPLNEERGFFSAVAHGGYIYAAGGGNGPAGEHLLQSVERAAIKPDGTLGSWHRLGSALVLPRRCVKLVLAGDTLYALGGFAGTLLDSVERADIGPDGELGPWRIEPNRLTMPRYVNAVKQHGDAVYVLGGHKETEGIGRTEVEFASIAPGAAPSWRRTTAMQLGRYALAAATWSDFLYALGGLDGARYTDRVELSRIGGDGALEAWRSTTALSSPRANFGTVVYRDRLYVIGGTNRDGYYRSVEYAGFNAGGDIGFWATPDQARKYEAQHAAQRRASGAPLPNAGVVREIIQTQAYSYIRVEQDGESRWLAAPRTDFRVGEAIRYSRGVAMTNFHSRALQRDFDEILFVESTQKVE